MGESVTIPKSQLATGIQMTLHATGLSVCKPICLLISLSVTESKRKYNEFAHSSPLGVAGRICLQPDARMLILSGCLHCLYSQAFCTVCTVRLSALSVLLH